MFDGEKTAIKFVFNKLLAISLGIILCSQCSTKDIYEDVAVIYILRLLLRLTSVFEHYFHEGTIAAI